MSSSNSGGSAIPSQIAEALSNSSKADVQKVGIALGVFVAASLVTVIAFELLRSNNKIVYEPKRKYAEVGGPAPPALSYRFLGWFAPVWRYSEDEMLNNAGMDAVVFLQFMKLCCWVSTALAIILGATLIPVDLVYNLTVNKGGSFSNRSTALSVITLAEMGGAYLYAHIAMSYVAVLVTLFFILRYYKHMVVLRWKYFRSRAYQENFAARTLLMTGVPRAKQSDAALSGLLSSLGLPYPTTEVHIGRVVGSLPDMIEKHDEMVRKLEQVLAKYLKDPDKISSKRPTIRVGSTLGMGGERVDAIEYYTSQINKLEAAAENWRDRIAERKPESYGFASLAAVPYAHAAAKSLRKKRPHGVEIMLASEPRNILWKNLTLSKVQRFRLSTIGFLCLVLLMFINAVPLLAVALIAQMSSFTSVLPFLRSWQDKSGWTFSLVSGLLPPAISGLMGYLFPILMRKIAKYRGEQTRTKLDKVVTGQFFAFLVVSQFIFFSLIGVFITSIATVVVEIVQHKSAGAVFNTLRDQTDVIKKQFLNMSNYWLTWLPLRMWMSTFDLAQGLKLVLVWVQKGFFGRTPRDVREYTKPSNFEYAIYYANFLFLFAVGAIYGVLAPLVMIFTACVFWVSFACYKYQFMYVSVSKVESGGQLWRLVVNRLLVVLVLMQLILMFVVALDDSGGLTQRIIKIALCAPPMLLVLMFKVYCRNRFDAMYDYYIPDSSEMASVPVHSGDQRHHRLQRRFGHPSLHQKLFTPMVHARVKHLLPQVYRGRLEHSGMVDVAGRKLETEEVMGGLRIAAVEENQLAYDPKLDSDGMSMMSASTRFGNPARAGTTDTSQFQNQYQQYLASGAVSRTDLQDTYEMSDMRDSQENLLEKRSAAFSPMSHGRKQSGNTLYSYGTPYATPNATPGLEYPPVGPQQGSMDLSQQPMGHQHHASNPSQGGNYFTGPVPTPGYSTAVGTPNSATSYYQNASPAYGPGGQHVRQQRSAGSIGAVSAMSGGLQPSQPRRTESPSQIPPPMGPVRGGPYPQQQQQYYQQQPQPQQQPGRTRQPSAGSVQALDQYGGGYDAADLYGGGHYAPGPYQQQPPPRHGGGAGRPPPGAGYGNYNNNPRGY